MDDQSGASGENLANHSSKMKTAIPPYHYIHIFDETTEVTRVETGPKVVFLREKEEVVLFPKEMVIIPPSHYCIILNPVMRNAEKDLMWDHLGQVQLADGATEVRLEQDPFPLYPGEKLMGEVKPLTVVLRNSALRLKAICGFKDGEIYRDAEDEWLFQGPGTYIPRVEVQELEIVDAFIIKPNKAIKLRALADTEDRDGKSRVRGEEWIVKKMGAYIPGVYEKIVGVLQAHILTPKVAVHVKATNTFIDEFGKKREIGDEWLITKKETLSYVPGVYEVVQGSVNITTLSSRQYCVILDPVDENGCPQQGRKKLVKGEKLFFLLPGESLEDNKVKDVSILNDTEGLILSASEDFQDTYVTPPVNRRIGEQWIIKGPAEYIPPVEVKVLGKRIAIPLKENEGVYVQSKTEPVRLEKDFYMLSPDEQLWMKDLPPKVVELLNLPAQEYLDKEYDRAITLDVPHNTCVQICDDKKRSRVVFGPDFIFLMPNEQFTLLRISGENHNEPTTTETLLLPLGPDYCTHTMIAETSDHVRLWLNMSYCWYFDVSNKSPMTASKLFSFPDFIGYLRQEAAARICCGVAARKYEDFRKDFREIIRRFVFELEEEESTEGKDLYLPINNLHISSVDVLDMEPVDQCTRDHLQKSVEMYLEAGGRHKAEKLELENAANIDTDQSKTEQDASRRQLLKLKADNMMKQKIYQAKAEAHARGKAQEQKRRAKEQAGTVADAVQIESDQQFAVFEKVRAYVRAHAADFNRKEVDKYKELHEIDVRKINTLMNILGKDMADSSRESLPFDLVPIASSQEEQVEALDGLTISSALTTHNMTFNFR